MALLVLGGLVIDASRLLNARGRAVAYAEEAARAGAGAVDLDAEGLAVVEEDARARVEGYCADASSAAGAGGTRMTCSWVGLEEVSETDRRQIAVHVTVRIAVPAGLLGIVGVRELTASGDGRARPVEGIDPADPDDPFHQP